MPVTRRQIISRGLSHSCPNCGHHELFRPEARYQLHRHCPQCGFTLSRGDGFYLGPLVINYTFTVAFVIVPLILLFVFDVIGGGVAIAACGTAAIVVPLLLYRSAWSWWIMGYFYFLPDQLPANRTATDQAADD